MLPHYLPRLPYRSICALSFAAAFPMSSSASSSRWPTQSYTPQSTSWPYKSSDFTRADQSSDDQFYTYSRLVTHIDDHAIAILGQYYADELPRRGRILDFCSSWISHFPPELEKLAGPGSSSGQELQVIGMGMDQVELERNPILSERIVQDLNSNPQLPDSLSPLGAAVCVVSIDYLTRPLEVLQSLREKLETGARVHLIISNRCFPTKAISRWLRLEEEQRLQMVGDYLHFAGFGDVEIVTLCSGVVQDGENLADYRPGMPADPLWVVRGRKA